MKRFGAIALAAGLLTTACSGHGGSNALPSLTPSGADRTGAGMTHRTSAAIAAPSGWAATNTQAYALKNATDLGALPATQSLTVRVGLQMHNASQLQQLVASGQTIDDGTYLAQYAPTAAEVGAVKTYLQSQGFGNITVEPNNLIVSGTASAAVVQKAFDTTLHSFTQNGLNVYANVTPAYVPQNLANVAIAVLGLNNAKAFATAPPKQAATSVTKCTGGVTTACVRFYDPATYAITYDVGSTPAASNTAVAIMTEGSLTNSISDFRYNEKVFGLPQATIQTVQVGLPSPDTAGSDEWTLDMTYSTGMAHAVKTLYVYNTTSLTDSDIALMYNRWVTDNKAKIGNSSFGGCEFSPYLDGSMVMMDQSLLQGAAHGQTMFVSTGDNGGFCGVGVPNGVPAGAPLVEYPAASPYAVAVGGTDLFSNADGSYKGESSWEAGGGGLSQFEYSPYWEAWAQPVSAQGQNFRGLPDVAMDASLETGADIWLGGTEYTIAGTSLASPLAAGAYARMQTAHGNALGFAAPRFYRIYQQNPAAGATLTGPPPTQYVGGFHDILAGSNVSYTALPRYDYTTGLGSLDIAKTNALIGK